MLLWEKLECDEPEGLYLYEPADVVGVWNYAGDTPRGNVLENWVEADNNDFVQWFGERTKGWMEDLMGLHKAMVLEQDKN